ncbi:hypothetical protein BV133_3179 [Blastochloris viridis]|uniref:Uncharacterized protein n=1 Tax=Blastochloris viridis TaxID=1079 RepID=A0A182D786_BLAVI|nr:hypothetical protein BV133_3179 [Blastochloris viridis]
MDRGRVGGVDHGRFMGGRGAAVNLADAPRPSLWSRSCKPR